MYKNSDSVKETQLNITITRGPSGLKDFRACKKKKKEEALTQFLLSLPSNGGLT